jgi:hypothetical protein
MIQKIMKKIAPSRRYPVILETHPYLVRDESEQACANAKDKNLPSEPVYQKIWLVKN